MNKRYATFAINAYKAKSRVLFIGINAASHKVKMSSNYSFVDNSTEHLENATSNYNVINIYISSTIFPSVYPIDRLSGIVRLCCTINLHSRSNYDQ